MPVFVNSWITEIQGNLGGARIGIVAKPSAEFVAAMLGTWLSGGVAVPLALSYPEAELLYVMINAVSYWNPPLLWQDILLFIKESCLLSKQWT